MKKFGAASVAAALLALSLAACSEEGSDSDAAPKDAIKIGMIGDYSKAGQFGNAQPERISAVKAALDAINKAGGIGGHDLAVIPCDQEADPNKAVSCARKLVEAGVIATVGDNSTDSDKYNPILAKAGVSRIGPLVAGATEYTAPNNYPLSGGAVSLLGGAIKLGAEEGHTKAVVVGIETPQAGTLDGLLAPVFKKTGVQHLKTILIPLGSTDLSQFVNQAKESGADMVVAAVNAQLLEQFLIDSDKLGAKYAVGAPGPALSDDSVEKLGGADGAAEGTLLAGAFPPSTAEGFKSIDQYNKEMDTRENSGDEHAAQATRELAYEAWLAAHAFADIAELVQGDITRESYNAALASAKDVEVSDTMPLWTPSESGIPLPRIGNMEGYFLNVKDGKIVLYSDERQLMF